MYSASSEFHDAVANGAHQMALLIFNNGPTVFTNDDIDVQEGISFHDYFNTNEDLSIGQALSNEISFTLFNDSGMQNYSYGDFTATIGVQTVEDTKTFNGTLYLDTGEHRYIATTTSPYLKRDGVALSSPPGRQVTCMLYYNGIVYCRLQTGAIIAYNDSTGAPKSAVVVTSIMDKKFRSWSGKSIAYKDNTLDIWIGRQHKQYEFVPLGVFNAERPNVPTVNMVHFTCYDMMQKFDVDMPSDSALGITYPISFTDLFIKLATYENLQYLTDGITINANAQLHGRPEAFDNATMRDVLQWLAEATGSVARINRDGKLVMDWVRSTDTVIDEHGYSEFNPYWYQTKQITKLHNRSSDGEYNIIIGSGTEGYLIQDNPLLRGVD